MRTLRVAAMLALGSVIATASAQDVSKTNCDTHDFWRTRSSQIEGSVGRGPFRLEAIYCQTLPEFGGLDFVTVSPDISSIALHHVYPTEIAVAPIFGRNDDATKYPFGLEGLYGGAVASNNFGSRPLRWSNDSQTLWTIGLDYARPSGVPRGSARPVQIENGTPRELPELRHAAGGLHSLVWTDDGRGLALFGVDSDNPTLAFVDATGGRVFESLTLRELGGSSRYAILVAEIVRLPDGRLRALLRIAQAPPAGPRWFVWTQGAPMQSWADPYYGPSLPVVSNLGPRDIDPVAAALALGNYYLGAAISADGMRVLTMRPLHPGYVCTEPAMGCSVTGPPVEGILATWHDIETGREIWTYRARSTNLDQYPRPELSDDGQYALIGLPMSGTPPRYSVALLSTRDGSVVQTFSMGDRGGTMGFARGSQRMWINERGGVTAVYAIR